MMQNMSSTSSTTRTAQNITTTSSLILVTSCPANQFGENCETFCLSRNDCFGHYTCERDNGEKRCISGWSGSDCDINIMDPSTDKGCPEAECFNNGQCFNVSCCCPSGYAGPLCQNKLSSCNVDICRNGGSCYESSTGNGYICACPADFTGILCESTLRDVITTMLPTTTASSSTVTKVTLCDSRLCVNLGTCIRTPEGDRCNCPPGFAGMYCEEFTTTTVKPRLCDENYYGENCEQFCLRQDDCELGQYTCDQTTGARVCKSGWVGSLCNFWQPPDLNDNVDCPDSTCRNGGICMNDTCCCPRGFTGGLCHIELLECDSQPCQNGARCRDLFGDYSCDCVSGYGGKNCDTLVNPDATPTAQVPSTQCRNVVCHNNGTCLPDESNGFVCLCGGVYMGRYCDVPIEEEEFTAIPGGLVCPVNYYGFDCAMYCKDSDSCGSGHTRCDRQTGEPICINGWVGDNCTRRIVDAMLDPECPGSPCRNNGQCFDGGCCCTPGYTGGFCEEEILECAQRPCLNEGSCIELVNSFTCICPDNYNGSLCESLISGNVSEANGTTVMATMSSSTTIGIGACANSPCLNSGTCFPSGVDYFCICQRNYRGISCEIDSRATFKPAITNLADNNSTANSTLVTGTRSVTTTFFPPFLNASETVNTTESNSTTVFSNSTEEVNGTTIGIEFSNTGDTLNNTTDYSNISLSTTNNDTIDYTPVSNFSNVTPSVSVIFITTMESITSDVNDTSDNSTMMTSSLSTNVSNDRNGTTMTIIAGGENSTMSTMDMGNSSDVMTNTSTETTTTTNGSAETNSTTAEMTSQTMESTTQITTVEITTQDLLGNSS